MVHPRGVNGGFGNSSAGKMGTSNPPVDSGVGSTTSAPSVPDPMAGSGIPKQGKRKRMTAVNRMNKRSPGMSMAGGDRGMPGSKAGEESREMKRGGMRTPPKRY
jgi:hypothetical protein